MLTREQLEARLAERDVERASEADIRKWAEEHRKKVYRDKHLWPMKSLKTLATALGIEEKA